MVESRQSVTSARMSTAGGARDTLASSGSTIGGPRTFYEGELSWKDGIVFSTKIFATILKNDPSLYVIDLKKLPRVDGQIPDRVDPFEEQQPQFEGTEINEEERRLKPNWVRFELRNSIVFASEGDCKALKLMINRADQGLPNKEERFSAANVCSRTIWVKKLRLASKFSKLVDDNAVFEGQT